MHSLEKIITRNNPGILDDAEQILPYAPTGAEMLAEASLRGEMLLNSRPITGIDLEEHHRFAVLNRWQFGKSLDDDDFNYISW